MALPAGKISRWQWTVCLLLLFATMINYMDRQVLSNMSVRISNQLELSETQYGTIEWAFGTAFALGSLAFGFLVDRLSVRLLYPAVLLAWSAVGFATGFVTDYESLLYCRIALGFFEAGHWPCAMVVTSAILNKEERAFGNSILQSGASFGAIITPLIIAGIFMLNSSPQAWRVNFQVVGLVGLVWAIGWWLVIPKDSLQRIERAESNPESASKWIVDLWSSRRFWALVVMIISINTSWQLIRAWLPKFLQQGRGYSESTSLYFNSAYYLATDIGCIGAGMVALRLARRGIPVHTARLITYAGCSLLACLTCVASVLPQSWALLFVMLIVGAGTLGLFPCYYSFSQELSTANLGKATGILAFLGWMASSPVHRLFGRYVDESKSYDLGIALVGLAPLLGLAAMLVLWREEREV